MLRVSEVIPQPNTQNRGMTLADLILVKGGAPTRSRPDGLHLVIRSSKTDQMNQGEIHWFARCINKEDPCPVQAAHEIKLMAQDRQTKDTQFVNRILNNPVTNSHLNSTLNNYTTKVLHMGKLSTHSMRSGGAVHLLNCKVDREIVKTLGRWKSTEALQMYVSKFEASTIDRVNTTYKRET